MKSNVIRVFTAIAVGFFAVCASVTPVAAQTAFKGSFTLADDVRWQGASLPAGDYSFAVKSRSLPSQVLVQGPAGTTAIIMTSATNKKASADGRSYLIVENRGGQHFIREMYLADLGVDLIYRAPSIPKGEQQLAQGPTSVEKVLIASNIDTH